MNRRDSLPTRRNPDPGDFGFAPSAVSIDNPRAWVSDLVVISPVVSTPGARPPQGGLCFCRMPRQRPSHALNHKTGFCKKLCSEVPNLSQFPSLLIEVNGVLHGPAKW